MADYTTQDEGIGGKGLLVAVILMGLFILALAFLGGGNGTPGALDPEGAAGSEAAPAVETAPAADPNAAAPATE